MSSELREGIQYGMIVFSAALIVPARHHCTQKQPLRGNRNAGGTTDVPVVLRDRSRDDEVVQAAWERREKDMGKACVQFKRLEDAAGGGRGADPACRCGTTSRCTGAGGDGEARGLKRLAEEEGCEEEGCEEEGREEEGREEEGRRRGSAAAATPAVVRRENRGGQEGEEACAGGVNAESRGGSGASRRRSSCSV